MSAIDLHEKKSIEQRSPEYYSPYHMVTSLPTQYSLMTKNWGIAIFSQYDVTKS